MSRTLRALALAVLLAAPALAAAPVARAEHDACAPGVLNASACVRTTNATWGAGSCDAGEPEYYTDRRAQVAAAWGAFQVTADVHSSCWDAHPDGAHRWRDQLRAWAFVVVPGEAFRAELDWADSGSTDPARPYRSCSVRVLLWPVADDLPCPDGRPPPILPALP